VLLSTYQHHHWVYHELMLYLVKCYHLHLLFDRALITELLQVGLDDWQWTSMNFLTVDSSLPDYHH